MARYRPEPAFDPDRSGRDAVLLVNLGTPDAPTPAAVRRYLAEFLADPRVVEIPRAIWLPLLYGVIVPLRARQSAEKYASIWDAEGSPLAVHTARQARLLRDWLDERLGRDAPQVEFAMRYGRPSIAEQLDRLRAAGCERILVLPLYPQYAASTTASVVDALGGWLARARNQPEVRCVRHFNEHPAYIAALAAQVRRHWQAKGRSAPLVMSFHGLPKFSVERGDPYQRECERSARRLGEALGLADNEWRLSFQSRFGRTEWLQPYTQPTLVELARGGARRVDVICPGFAADCLETLEELGIVARRAFIEAGGAEFNLIPCLNESAEWIDALGALVRENSW